MWKGDSTQMPKIYASGLTEFCKPPYLAWFVLHDGSARRQLLVDELQTKLRWSFDGEELTFRLIPVMGDGRTPVYLEQQ